MGTTVSTDIMPPAQSTLDGAIKRAEPSAKAIETLINNEQILYQSKVIFLNLCDVPFRMRLIVTEQNVFIFKRTKIVRRHALHRLGAFITSSAST